MESTFEIKAYETNQITLYAVQGEVDSRTIKFKVVEKSGIQIAMSNAEVTNKMLDLTDCIVQMYVTKPNGEVVICDGTITNAQEGEFEVTLSADITTNSGKANCCIIISKNETNLRIVGIAINIADVNIDGSTNIEMYAGTTKTIALIIYDNNKQIYKLSNNDILILAFGGLQKEYTSDCQDIDGICTITLNFEDTANMSGTYEYNIAIKTSDILDIIVAGKITIKRSVLSL